MEASQENTIALPPLLNLVFYKVSSFLFYELKMMQITTQLGDAQIEVRREAKRLLSIVSSLHFSADYSIPQSGTTGSSSKEFLLG